MAFLVYERRKNPDGSSEFKQLRNLSLAGSRNGVLAAYVKRQRFGSGTGWAIGVEQILKEAGYAEANTYAVIIDLKPGDKEGVSLYELKRVFGYTSTGWTPIMLHLEALFAGQPKENVEEFKQQFSDVDCPEERRPVHTFLYLQDTYEGGSWNWGPVGTVNAALLWPEAIEFFINHVRKNLAAGP